MRFSQYFDVTPKPDDDWFDPILIHDTALFIDPVRLKSAGGSIPGLASAYPRIASFFNVVFAEAAGIKRDRRHPRYRRLESLLQFPEVREICLGYTKRGTRGAGSAKGLARLYLDGVFDSIEAGVKDVDAFEEVALFQEDIGADRISDMAANVTRVDLAAYTATVCARHQIPVTRVTHPRACFDAATKRWEPAQLDLPHVELDGERRPILLVPRSVLRVVPSINWRDLGEFLMSVENDVLRAEMDITIKDDIDRKKVLRLARKFRSTRTREFVERRIRRPLPPYDLARDTGRRYRWHTLASAYVRRNPVPAIGEVVDAVDEIIARFLDFMEEHQGWKLVWNENGTRKKEEAAQLAFMAVADPYCREWGIDLTREAGTGRGPVDFKFSFGSDRRVVVEVKLASNSALEHGVTEQTPTYAKAQNAVAARVVIIAHTPAELERIHARIEGWLATATDSSRIAHGGAVISALKPPSASKRSRGRRVGRVYLPPTD